MNRSERVYRALLLAFPERTRLIHGEDMVQLFRDRMRDADSPLARADVWLEAFTDIVVTAPREHLAPRSMAEVVEGPLPASPRPIGADLAAASVPLVLAVLVGIMLPGYYRPLFDPSVGILGLPLGIAMLIPATVLAAIGIFGARRGGVRDPQAQLVVLVVLLSPLLLAVTAQLPFAWIHVLAVVWLAARDSRHAPVYVLTGALLALPLILVSGAAAPLAAYAVVVTLFMLAARVRWLLYAMVLPFALVLAFGPSLVLIALNLRG